MAFQSWAMELYFTGILLMGCELSYEPFVFIIILNYIIRNEVYILL